MISRGKADRGKFVYSFSEPKNGKFNPDKIHSIHYNDPQQQCILLSGYVNADMVKDYSGHREKYAAKRTLGLAKAVAECDAFLVDPEVSFKWNIFFLEFLHINFFLSTTEIRL